MFLTKTSLAVLALILLFGLVFPSYAEEKKYTTWEEVATDMSAILDKAVEVFVPGDKDAAKQSKVLINEAYFKFYEKLGFEKAVMGAISGKRGSAVEFQFYTCKKILKSAQTTDELKVEIDKLKAMLHEDAAVLDGSKAETESTTDGGEGGDSSASGTSANSADEHKKSTGSNYITFLAVFGLTMREGLEAILVIGAIVAYLVKTNNKKHLKSVYIGAVLGIVFSVLLALVFNFIAQTVSEADSGIGQEIFEGVAMFVAVIVLFHVSNWMLSKSDSEAWSKYIKDKVSDSVSKGNVLALSFSAFIAVAREGAELILFFQGMRKNISNDPMQMWMGLLVAAILLIIIYVAVTRFSVRLPLKPFFIATSALMFVMCVSFLGKGVFELQEADVIGRTFISGFPESEWLEWFGIYNRWESVGPQIILILVTIATVIVHARRNKKRREEFAANSKSK
ncbi:MAG: FTR1 family protein [Bacillota bacterium]|nr:FTR1 family protein [Bacillota bacterium]